MPLTQPYTERKNQTNHAKVNKVIILPKLPTPKSYAISKTCPNLHLSYTVLQLPIHLSSNFISNLPQSSNISHNTHTLHLNPHPPLVITDHKPTIPITPRRDPNLHLRTRTPLSRREERVLAQPCRLRIDAQDIILRAGAVHNRILHAAVRQGISLSGGRGERVLRARTQGQGLHGGQLAARGGAAELGDGAVAAGAVDGVDGDVGVVGIDGPAGDLAVGALREVRVQHDVARVGARGGDLVLGCGGAARAEARV